MGKNDDFSKLIRKMCFTILGMNMALMYSTDGYDFNPKNVNKTSLNPVNKIERSKDEGYEDRYAILISGHDDYPFNEDLMKVNASLEKAGYDKDDIYVLAADRRSIPKETFDLYSFSSNVEYAFKEVEKKIDENDSLLVFITDHGLYNEYDKASFVSLPGGWIHSYEVELYMRDMKFKNATVIVDACHSGEFSERLGKNNVVALSTSNKKRVGYKPSKFARSVVQNFYEQDPDADYDDDGKVSFEEAVDRAAKEDWLFTRVEDWPYRRFIPIRQCPQLQYQDVDPSELFPE